MHTIEVTEATWDFDSPWLPGTTLLVYDDGCRSAFDSLGRCIGSESVYMQHRPGSHASDEESRRFVNDLVFEPRSEREIYEATQIRGPIDRLLCWLGDHDKVTVALAAVIVILALAALFTGVAL